MNTKGFVIVAAVLVAIFEYFFSVFVATRMHLAVRGLLSGLVALTGVFLAYLIFRLTNRK